MARGVRLKPKRLTEKLIRIRLSLGLSQNDLIKTLDVDLTQNRISEYERGTGEPPLPILLKYARLAGVCVDVLIDDDQNLPTKLPAKPKHGRA
ncbi:MAG: Helix-turn-helix domain [Pyrinomonadaceae bacterium]|nr:Helix-turn-helix domain [Pyrinomonadaceae bacterium]